MSRITSQHESERVQLALLVRRHYGGVKNRFAKGINRSWNCVHYWMTGHTPVPSYVWDHFKLLKKEARW